MKEVVAVADEMTFVFEGGAEFDAALEAWATRMDAAARAAVVAGSAVVELAAKTKLAQYSHAPNTPTPSPPGQPPALIDGSLRRSVITQGPTSTGPGAWRAQIGPTIVYARIQELGGVCGWGHRTTLPPRPYLAPALAQVVGDGSLSAAMQAAWAAAQEV